MSVSKIDFAPAQRLFDALYGDRDWFHVLAYTEEGVAANEYDEWVQERLVERGGKRFVCSTKPLCRPDLPRGHRFVRPSTETFKSLAYWNHRKMGIAATVCTFTDGARRQKKDAVAMSAFAIDVDPKEFDRIKPGATSAEEIIPAAVALLAARGIVPHAVVTSGRGAHLYVCVERIDLTVPETRRLASLVWRQLCIAVGGALDKHDFSAVLRVPGSINWKGNVVKVTGLVEEHTDFTRPRYRLEDLAAALADVPAGDGADGERAVAGEGDGDEVTVEIGDATEAERQLVDIALQLDKDLIKLREVAHTGKGTNDRSRADWAYACRLIELGMPESVVLHELLAGSKAHDHDDPEYYARHTFWRACRHVWPRRSPSATSTWKVYPSPEAASYQHDQGAPPLTNLGGTLVPADDREEVVKIVLTRPGGRKTRGVVEALARSSVVAGGGRTGLLGMFVRELLHHEYAINRLYPNGFEHVGRDDITVRYTAPVPKTHEELFERTSNDGRDLWPLERLRQLVGDPGAFYINVFHPLQADARLEESDEPDPTPAAVVKFRGREDFCLLGLDGKQLNVLHQPCSTYCPATACRANGTSPDQREHDPEDGSDDGGGRGAKTYWGSAPFALLTHEAFAVQGVYKPSANRFDGLIVDELPGFVYRQPRITFTHKLDDYERPQWTIEPIDKIHGFFTRLLAADADAERPRISSQRRADVRAALDKLNKFSDDIKKVARQRMTKLKESEKLAPKERTATREERRVDERPFILTTDEFGKLLTVSKLAAAIDELADDDEDEGSSSEMTRPLMLLRDFCGDGDMQIVLGHSFEWDGQGDFWVCRPVDGWDDLLEGGGARDLTLLDATAGMDPRYLLRDQFPVEKVPEAIFPRTTIVLMESTSKTAIAKHENAPEEVVEQLVRQIAPYLDEIRSAGDALLVITDKKMEPRIRQRVEQARAQHKLPAKTIVDHFGGLRGRNDYDQFTAVYMTQPYVYPEGFYLGLGLLLHGFSGEGVTKQWSSKNSWPKYPPLRARAIVSDIYQDATRIGIRRDPARTAFIFLPTDRPEHVIRIARLFHGAKLVHNGNVLREPTPAPPILDEEGAPSVEIEVGYGISIMRRKNVAPNPSSTRTGFGKPRYDIDED